jgi:hypothetical protein
MLLSSEGVNAFVFDENISSIEGSINIFPIRVMVAVSDALKARSILVENGILMA